MADPPRIRGRLFRKYATLLIIDETHTICAGPGGFTRAHKLEPDILVFGKAIGGGIPWAAYGCSKEVAEKITKAGGTAEVLPKRKKPVRNKMGTKKKELEAKLAAKATKK